jgi:hypothetical protein
VARAVVQAVVRAPAAEVVLVADLAGPAVPVGRVLARAVEWVLAAGSALVAVGPDSAVELALAADRGLAVELAEGRELAVAGEKPRENG